MDRTRTDDDPTVPHVPTSADIDRDAAVDTAELHRMAERMDALALRADASGRRVVGSHALVVADALRDIARSLTANPLQRKP